MAMGLVDPILFPNTDQYDEMFRTGAIMNHTVSASGGNDKINFYTSLGIMDQEGLQIHNDYSRYNMRLNVDYKVRDNVKIGIRTDGSWSERQTPRGAGLETAGLKYVISGILNKHPETGEYGGAMAYGESASAGNAVAEYEAYRTNTSRKEFNGNAYLEWEPLKDLKLNVSYALRYYNQFSKSIQNVVNQMNFQTNSIARTMPDTGDIISNSNNEGHKTLFQGRITYEKEIFKGHHISAMFNAAEEYWFQRNMGAGRKNRLHNSLEELDAASKEVQTNDGKSESEGLRSFIGRVNYTLFDKYLFEFNFRSDGSSRFAKGHQWGFFPSAAVGWRVSEEAFFAPLKKAISNAKFRASYGSLGNNSGVGRYEQKETMGTTNYIVGNNGLATGFSANKMINQDLSWEETRVINIGLDLGFFNNRLSFIFDYYNRTTDDLLTDVNLPAYTGFSSMKTNLGKLRNSGFEMEVRANILSNAKGFNWEVSANLTSVSNKVLKLPTSDKPFNQIDGYEVAAGLYNPETGETPTKWIGGYREGGRLGDMIGYVQNHIFRDWNDVKANANMVIDEVANLYGPGMANEINPQTGVTYAESNGWKPIEPGDVCWEDVNGDGHISQLDRVVVGNIFPNVTGGFTTTFGYKNVSLYARFDYSLGHTIYNDLKARSLGQYQGSFNLIDKVKDTWSETNRDADLPVFTYADQLNKMNITRENNGYTAVNGNSSRFYEKGDYLALREITLNWNLPKTWISRVGMQNASLYVTGQNLFYITGYDGASPEPAAYNGYGAGIDNGRYPTPRTLLFGLSVTF